MTWDPLTKPVDYFRLSGVRSPGIAELLDGAGAPFKWDERGGYGLSGSTLVFRGNGLAKFAFRIKLYTVEEWALWNAWKPLVARPPLGERAKAQDIWHPLLEQIGVKAAVVEELGAPTQPDAGEWAIVIKFLEWRRPKLALAKPDGAKATPADPIDQVIKELANQVQELAAE